MTSTDGDTRFVNLMTPARFGRLELRNRVVMAPMTRHERPPTERSPTSWSSTTASEPVPG